MTSAQKAALAQAASAVTFGDPRNPVWRHRHHGRLAKAVYLSGADWIGYTYHASWLEAGPGKRTASLTWFLERFDPVGPAQG